MKPTIAFVTGGYSGESVISYKSAITLQNNLDYDRFIVYRHDITPEGLFHPTVAGKKINFDAVLIGIHGTPGEDGKLQGYFDLMGLPYTSCDSAVSALTFNKRYTVAVAAFNGIHVARSILLIKGRMERPDEG